MENHTKNANVIDAMWDQTKTAYIEASESCLWYKQKKK